MKIYLSYRERMAGLFLVFAFLAVVAFIVGAAIQNRWLEPRVAYHTHVVRGDALRSGSPVYISGIEVGDIGELKILSDNRIDVELLIRKTYADRVRRGTVAEIRRVVGLGEKRILLAAAEKPGAPLPAGALLPANEPMDIIDAIANVDLGRYVNTLDRAVAAMEITLKKLEEKDRLERIMEAFDQMGPTMERMNNLLADLHDPLIDIVSDPNFKGAFDGAAKVFKDPNTRKTMEAMATTFEPQKMGRLISTMESAFNRFDAMAAEKGEFTETLANANRLLTDKRVDRLLTSMETLTDSEKISKLVENMAIVAREMAKMGPQIPALSREMLTTLREAVVVLKALQKTWLLKDESKEVRKNQ